MQPCYNPELFEAFRCGDLAALEEYYKLYSVKIYSHVFQKTKDQVLAIDICTDAFMALRDRRQSIKEEKHVVGFLLKTANNMVHASFRQQVRDNELLAELSYQLPTATSPDIRDTASAEADLKKSFHGLTPRRRKILALYYLHGLSVREIAVGLAIKEQTVRNHLSQTMEKLRNDLLGRWGENNPLFS